MGESECFSQIKNVTKKKFKYKLISCKKNNTKKSKFLKMLYTDYIQYTIHITVINIQLLQNTTIKDFKINRPMMSSNE